MHPTTCPEAMVRRWLERVVVGLNLCPFAASVVRGPGLDLRISVARDLEDAYQEGLGAAAELLGATDETPVTTLLAFPHTLGDFDDYLDVVAALRGTLHESGADGLLQVATFHPGYRFEGEPEGDPSHWTNRAPVPLLHFLREQDVALAVDNYPEADRIPTRNIARLREMGLVALSELWEGLVHPESQSD